LGKIFKNLHSQPHPLQSIKHSRYVSTAFLKLYSTTFAI
jgi:hypothetical protein